MADRKPSVKCACGHSFDIPPAQLFTDVACPKCGKVILGPGKAAAPKSETLPKAAPKSETLAAAKDAAAGPKTDPTAPKTDSTKGGTPGSTRKPPLFVKEGPLPAPIPGYTFQKRLGQGG